jgi:hypothetical protein
LCGVPASLLANWIWKGALAATVTSDWSNLIPVALIWTTAVEPEPPPDGAPEAPPLGAPDAPPLGAPDAAPLAPAAAAPLWAGVADGAGAYVQPGAAVEQATTITTERSTSDRRGA